MSTLSSDSREKDASVTWPYGQTEARTHMQFSTDLNIAVDVF